MKSCNHNTLAMKIAICKCCTQLTKVAVARSASTIIISSAKMPLVPLECAVKSQMIARRLMSAHTTHQSTRLDSSTGPAHTLSKYAALKTFTCPLMMVQHRLSDHGETTKRTLIGIRCVATDQFSQHQRESLIKSGSFCRPIKMLSST